LDRPYSLTEVSTPGEGFFKSSFRNARGRTVSRKKNGWDSAQAGYDAGVGVEVDEPRPLGECRGLDTDSLNGVASGAGGYRHCAANYGVGNAAIARYRRQAGAAAVPRRLRRHRVVYYAPNAARNPTAG